MHVFLGHADANLKTASRESQVEGSGSLLHRCAFERSKTPELWVSSWPLEPLIVAQWVDEGVNERKAAVPKRNERRPKIAESGHRELSVGCELPRRSGSLSRDPAKLQK